MISTRGKSLTMTLTMITNMNVTVNRYKKSLMMCFILNNTSKVIRLAGVLFAFK